MCQSRLSRDLSDSAFLLKEMEFYDVELLSASDGMSSYAPSAKPHFFLKGFMGQQFLDNLRDKTLRGQKARFTAGYATGGVAFGFRTTEKKNADGATIAHEISINEEQATVVRRIFREYLGGRSLALISTGLNADRVPPPRSKKRKGSPVWGDSSVRGILHNEVYAGVWHFARRKWTKVPGTNTRRPKFRSPNDVPLAQNRPHLRIIDEQTWSETQRRLAEVRRHYFRGTTGQGSIHGRPNHSVLSGLLVCDHCGSLMFINGRGSNRRYRCSGNAKRGICSNRLSVREDVARACILAAVRTAVIDDLGVAYARTVAAQRLGDRERVVAKELKPKRAELVKTEARIRSLIEQLADGGADDYLRKALDELAGKANQLKGDIAELEATGFEPVELPEPAKIRAIMEDLQAFVDRDPLGGREYLRKLLKNQQVRLQAQPEGIYLAKTEILPMVLITTTPPSGLPKEALFSSRCCGGR